MKNKIPHKSFDEQMHIIRDVHFDINKYKIGELYVINNPLHTSYLHFGEDRKTVAKLIAVDEHSLTFNTMRRCEVVEDYISYKYTIHDFILTIDEIIEKQIEIERLMTETEASVYLMGTISKECAKDIIPEQIDRKPVIADKYKGDLSWVPPLLGIDTNKERLQAAYKINTPEEAVEIAKDSQMNIVNDIMKGAEEEKNNYVVWLIDSFSGISNKFSILDSEGNFNPEPFKGLSTGSCRVWVKLFKGNSTVQFNVHSKYIKVSSDVIAIIGNKNKSSICMTLMRDSFREMFDKIEFEQIL